MKYYSTKTHEHILNLLLFVIKISFVTSINMDIKSAVYTSIYDSQNTSYGYIMSPHYPAEYSNNLDCTYEFRGKENEGVVLYIEDFELEPPQPLSVFDTSLNNINFGEYHSYLSKRPNNNNNNNNNNTTNAIQEATLIYQCFYDSFDIYSIDSDNTLKLRDRYCGTSIDKEIFSTTPNLIVNFKTDKNLRYRGFKIRYHFSSIDIVPFVTNPICGKIQHERDGGIIQSPNYPFVYPSGLSCAWTITVEKHKKILIKFIDINFHEDCHSTYVSLYDGYVERSNNPTLTKCQKLIYYIQGDTYYESKTNRMVIKFNGNIANSSFSSNEPMPIPEHQKNEKRGFLLTWTAIYKNDTCDEFKCKGGETCIEAQSVICIKSPSYCIGNSLICDGNSHCGMNDNSDEEDCSNMDPRQNLIYISVFAAVISVLVLSIITCIVSHVLRKKRSKKYMSGKQKKHAEIKFDPGNIGLTNIQFRRKESLIHLSRSFPELHEKLEHMKQQLKTKSTADSLLIPQNRDSYVLAQGIDFITKIENIPETNLYVNTNNTLLRRNSYNQALTK